MTQRTWPWLLCVALLTTWGCGKAQQSADDGSTVADAATEELSEVDQAAEETWEIWEETEDPEVKVGLARDFLERYPDSDHTGDFLGSAVYHFTESLDRPDEAYELVEATLSKVEDADTRLDTQMQLAVLHSKTERLEELSTLADTMAEEHSFQFTDHLRLMELGTEAGAWNLVVEQAEAGLAFASTQAFKAQWPDESDEYAARAGQRRSVYCMAYKGWAQENLGQHEAALATFSGADDDTTYSLLGVDDTPLHLYWGKTLLLQGEPDAAMAKLTAEALFGSEEAKESFAEAWTAAHDSDDGLEERLWALRQEYAKPLPQFALPNYEGETFDSTEFIGDVLLVAAWHPT
jgi:tetratricopeptide (TPR) repeat protein